MTTPASGGPSPACEGRVLIPLRGRDARAVYRRFLGVRATDRRLTEHERSRCVFPLTPARRALARQLRSERWGDGRQVTSRVSIHFRAKRSSLCSLATTTPQRCGPGARVRSWRRQHLHHTSRQRTSRAPVLAPGVTTGGSEICGSARPSTEARRTAGTFAAPPPALSAHGRRECGTSAVTRIGWIIAIDSAPTACGCALA